jgi:hypothetical protein
MHPHYTWMGSALYSVLQRLGVTVAGVYRQFHKHWSEPLELMARVAWARARETVHIYGGTRDGARLVWTQLYSDFYEHFPRHMTSVCLSKPLFKYETLRYVV